jgi:ribosomal silencing factor RsfS
MAGNNFHTSPTQKKRSSSPNKNVGEANKAPTNEFCSYNSSTTLSTYYFGLNIFDYYTSEQLASLVKDPIGNNEILRKISLMLYSANGVYTNTVDYMTAMPTLDKVIVTHGQSKRKKQANKEKMISALHTIKHKEIVRDALFKGMIEGIAFYYFETTTRPLSKQKTMTDYDVESIVEINELGINASVISLPVDYTRIVGIKNSSYVIAFNLDYFDDCTGETLEKKLRKYPKEIRDAYHNRVDTASNDGNWVVLDNTKTIVHKIRSKRDEKWGRPLVLAAIR